MSKEVNTGKLAVRLSCISILYFILVSFGTYNSVFLKSLGLNPRQVGLFVSALSLLSLLATPVFGILSDRARHNEGIIQLLVVITFAANILTFVFDNDSGQTAFYLCLGFFALSVVFRAPLGALIENYLLFCGKRFSISYGRSRGLGSLAFSAVCVILGFVSPLVEIRYMFLAMNVINVVIFLLTSQRLDKGNVRIEKGEKISLKELFVNKRFLMAMVFSGVIYISTNCNFTFLPYLFEDIGLDVERVGLLIGYAGFVEVPILLFFDKLARRGFLKGFYAFSGLLYTAESVLYYFANSFWFLMLVVSTIRGIAHGLYVGAGNNYIYEITDEKQRATAMSVYTSMGSVAGIFGNAFGGLLIEAFSIKIYFLIIGILSAIVTVLFVRKKDQELLVR